MTVILGISALYHDAAAAVVVDGQIVAAAQEERFSRVKNDWRFPKQAIDYCLAEAGVEPGEVDYAAFYDKPLLKFDRLLETYLAAAPWGYPLFAATMPSWLRERLHVRRKIKAALGREFRRQPIFPSHHQSHAASAFFPSPFDEAAILTLDGVGEWATATQGVGRGNQIELHRELRFPHSLGLLYSAFTAYCGFRVNSGEYKLMGLAPYGQPVYADAIRNHLIDLKTDGSFRMDPSYFRYCRAPAMTSTKFHRLFGGPPRRSDEQITQRHMDVAASIQRVAEEIMLRMARALHDATGQRRLVMAGGVALNCVANGRLVREGPFEEIWIQPAAGDAGGALGAALFVWHQLLGKERQVSRSDSQHGSLLGPAFSDQQIAAQLDNCGAKYHRAETGDDLCRRVAGLLADGKIVGWVQGRMEFGPRALGARSILADPRGKDVQQLINQKIKFRESFRPFAPAVLADKANEYFDLPSARESPYMLLTAPVAKGVRCENGDDDAARSGFGKIRAPRSSIPAVTHVDCSARVQTVDDKRHPLFAQLLREFEAITGLPVLVNTSFNVRNEPIVCTPADAWRCFVKSNLDVLAIGRCLLFTGEQRDTPADEIPKAASAHDRLGEPTLPMVSAAAESNSTTLAVFGSLCSILLVAVSCKLFQLPATVATVAAALAACLFGAAIGWRWPNFWHVPYRIVMALTFPLRWLVSITALAAVYFMVLSPLALLLRLLGRKPLETEFDSARESYWLESSASDEAASYFRQF